MNICKHGSVCKKKHKYWELQITNEFSTPYFNFQIQWTRNQDHAGFQILIELFGLMVDFKIYDNRHWDYENKCYIDS